MDDDWVVAFDVEDADLEQRPRFDVASHHSTCDGVCGAQSTSYKRLDDNTINQLY